MPAPEDYFLNKRRLWALPPGAGGGESNTSSNVGTGEGTLAKAKSGVDLPFKSLKQGSNITITNNTNDVTITATGGGASALTDLTDVTITSPSTGEYVRKSAGDWVNSTLQAGDLPAHSHAKTEVSDTGTWETTEIPNLDTSKITTGTMATARLGSGTADSTTFLRGDQTYAVPSGGGGINTLKKSATQIINGTAFQNISDLTFSVA